MAAVPTREQIATKYGEQRQHLQRQLDDALAELDELTARRGPLAYDAAVGNGGQTELAGIERKMASTTGVADRLRDALVELDRREANEQEVAGKARQMALRKDLDRQVVALAKASGSVADLVEALGAAVTAAHLAEDLAAGIAGQLDEQLDPLSVAFLLPRALLEQSIVLQPIDHLEKQQILAARTRKDAEFRPTERLRAKRQVRSLIRMRSDRDEGAV